MKTNQYASSMLKEYESFLAKNDWEKAKCVLETAVSCNCISAKIELARFLQNTPELEISKQERFTNAEALYIDVLTQGELPNNTIAVVARELASLYGAMNRPIAFLAFLLMARRHGALISEDELELCKRQLHEIDINDLGRAQEVYALGFELYLLDGMFDRLSEYFLRVASEANDGLIKGMAYLTLADFYECKSNSNPFYREEAIRCYRLAKENGFPEYLTSD